MIKDIGSIVALQDTVEWLNRLAGSKKYSIDEINKDLSLNLPIAEINTLLVTMVSEKNIDDFTHHMINFSSVIELLKRDNTLTDDQKEHSISALKSAMIKYTFIMSGNGQKIKNS